MFMFWFVFMYMYLAVKFVSNVRIPWTSRYLVNPVEELYKLTMPEPVRYWNEGDAVRHLWSSTGLATDVAVNFLDAYAQLCY